MPTKTIYIHQDAAYLRLSTICQKIIGEEDDWAQEKQNHKFQWFKYCLSTHLRLSTIYLKLITHVMSFISIMQTM